MTRKCARRFYANVTVADQEKCRPFFVAINAGDIAEVERMLTESPWLMQSRSLKGNPPLVVAQYSRDPSAMTVLLVSKGVDMDTLMCLCTKGLRPETSVLLLQAWSEELQSTASPAYNSIELQLIGCLLARISRLSDKEKESMWNLLVEHSRKNRKDIVPFASDLFKSQAGRDLFDISGSSDSEILQLNMEKLGSGFKNQVIFRNALEFIRFSMNNQTVTLLEAMESVGPDIVRPIVFMCLHDSKSSMLENTLAEIYAIGDRFKRDSMWRQARELFLARVQAPSPALPPEQIRLVDLPDTCFRAVVEFYQEPLDTENAVKKLREGFCCSQNMLFTSCACHCRPAIHAVNRVDDYDLDSGGEGGYWLSY